MVLETRFSWNEADDEGFALRRPDIDPQDDGDFDFDDLDPQLPVTKRRCRPKAGGRDGESPERPG